MCLLFSNPLFLDDAMVRILSHTLIHSLWQGMLLAVVAGTIMFLTKNASPAMRYNLLTAALLLFTAGVLVTFCVLMAGASSDAVKLLSAPGTVPGPSPGVVLTEANTRPATQGFLDLFNASAGWLVLVWMAVICFKCLQLTAGLHSMYRFRKTQILAAGKFWEERLVELQGQLQIKRTVRLLQSGIAKIPSVIGIFKPVILFPAGMLSAMPPDEVEAVLLHELAHIRRKDFAVNFLQYILEIIFFFNPAVRWVSSVIRVERENCCDEIAIRQTDNKRNYINALVAFQELNHHLYPPLATGFAGEQGQLINRVKRIIYNNNKTLNNMEKKLLVAGILITSVFVFAFSPKSPQEKKDSASMAVLDQVPGVEKNATPPVQVSADTVPSKATSKKNAVNGTINMVLDQTEYKLVTNNGGIEALYVDGKKIAAEKLADYKTATDKIFAEVERDRQQAQQDKLDAEQDMQQATIDKQEAEKEMAEANTEMKLAKEQMEVDMQQAKKEMEQANLAMEQSNKEMEHAKLDAEHAWKDNAFQKEQAEKEMQLAKKNMELTKLQLARSKKEIARSMKDLQASKRSMEAAKVDMQRAKQLQENLVTDLIKENVISDRNALQSFNFTNEELIVNGVKQPDSIFKKLRARYGKKGNWSMQRNHNDNANGNKKDNE